MHAPIETIAIPGFSDPFSSISHLVGAGVFFFMGVILLIRNRGEFARTVAFLIFVIGVTFALSMSGVFHLLSPHTTGREVLQRLDHAGIFFLIAATFTPIHVIVFRGFLRWGILLLIWTATITGITLKTIFFNDVAEWLGLLLYLSMGWIGVLSAFLLQRRYGIAYIKPLYHGAVAYTTGAILEYARFPVLIPGVIGPHELFHLLVLAGVTLHWMFIYRVVYGHPVFYVAEPEIKVAMVNE